VLAQGLRVDRGLPCGAGGIRRVLQREQRVDRLLRPGLVQASARLGDSGQLPQQVRVMQIST